MSDTQSIAIGDRVQWRQTVTHRRAPEIVTGTVRQVHRLAFHTYALVEVAQEHFYMPTLDELTKVEPAKQVQP